MSLNRSNVVDIDLQKPLQRSNAGALLACGDSLANVFGANVYDGGVEASLTGASCTGYFIRPGADTVVIAGTVAGNTASVVLPQACYTASGNFALAIKLTQGDMTHTLRVIDGYVKTTTTGTIIDPGTVVPSLDTLLAKIAACDAATAAATTAAGNAQSVADGYADELEAISQTLSTDVKAVTDKFNASTLVIDNLSAGYYYKANSISAGMAWSSIVPVQNDLSYYSGGLIDVSAYQGDDLVITSSTPGSGNRGIGFCDSNGIVTSCISEALIPFVYDDALGKYAGKIPVTGVSMFLSISKARDPMTISISHIDAYSKDEIDAKIAGAEISSSIGYVSTAGSDSSSGGAGTPLATVNRALELGYSTIAISSGVYEQTIDLSKLRGGTIKLMPKDHTKKTIFTDAGRVIVSSATAVSGYSKVYSALLARSVDASAIFIYQDGIPDETTLISDAERHPLERGLEYRCEDTQITLCSATALDAALQEIESADGYKCYIDAATTTIYFSSPEAPSALHPICAGDNGKKLFENASRAHTIIASGIECKYMSFNIDYTSGSVITDCKASNIRADGAFTYDKCVGGKFVRCEANRCAKGAHGDGFNGHASLSGDPFAKQTTIFLIECWSHDNYDDGYSDHERSETTIIGGLYEYNGKGGVTPSFGSHCTCYNVLSRNNFSGFHCTGEAEAEEGGKYTQMVCYNCIAENNTSGGFKSGYVVKGKNNLAVLYGCKSIGHDYGYNVAEAENTMRLVDCTTLNDTVVKASVGTLVISNTVLVAE